MRELRIVHLRYHPYFEPEGNDSTKRSCEITSEFQCFADNFFQYLDRHGICPKLTALVIGCSWEDKSVLKDPRNYHNPRHCFIKGHQKDVLGRSAAIGVPVPAWQFRQAQSASGILDLDPECIWIGGQASRLRESWRYAPSRERG